mgnify:FL=1
MCSSDLPERPVRVTVVAMSLPFGFSMGNPDDPDGSGGMPSGFDMNSLGAALQQLGAMMQSGQTGAADGPVNWAMVTDVARKALVQAGDPSVSDAERRSVDEAMRLADLWLDPVVDFPAVAAVPQAWSRSEWLEATAPVWRQIVQPVAEQMQQAVGGAGSIDPANLQDRLPEQLRAMLPEGGIPP